MYDYNRGKYLELRISTKKYQPKKTEGDGKAKITQALLEGAKIRLKESLTPGDLREGEPPPFYGLLRKELDKAPMRKEQAERPTGKGDAREPRFHVVDSIKVVLTNEEYAALLKNFEARARDAIAHHFSEGQKAINEAGGAGVLVSRCLSLLEDLAAIQKLGKIDEGAKKSYGVLMKFIHHRQTTKSTPILAKTSTLERIGLEIERKESDNEKKYTVGEARFVEKERRVFMHGKPDDGRTTGKVDGTIKRKPREE